MIIKNYVLDMKMSSPDVENEDRYLGTDFEGEHYLIEVEGAEVRVEGKGAPANLDELANRLIVPKTIYRLTDYNEERSEAHVEGISDEALIRKVVIADQMYTEDIHQEFINEESRNERL